ncbi:MAG: archease [Candidatus Micrarchaeota archaeon]
MKSKRFIFKDHKADMFIEAYGKSYPEALENCAAGLFETICDASKLKERKKLLVKEKASTLEQLTTFLLNKIVSEGDAREMMYKRMKVIKFEEKKGMYSVKAQVFGQEAVHKLGRMYVKAVTHHEATVEKKGKNWLIRVLPDI